LLQRTTIHLALFAVPVLLLIIDIGWMQLSTNAPSPADVFYILTMIAAIFCLPKSRFLTLGALCLVCAAMGHTIRMVRFDADTSAIVASLFAFIGLAICVALLAHWRGESQRLKELDRILNTTPVFLWTADGKSGGVDSINRHWTELGWSFEDLGGDRWGVMMHPDDIDRLVVQWQTSVATGVPYEETMRVRHAAGGYRWMVIRARPGLEESGAVRRWYGVAIDIDDLKQAEERLERMRNDLTRVTRANTLGELTASIAHDINQPLAAAVTNGQVALRWLTAPTPDMGEIREAVEEAVSSAKRASDVVEHLRSLYQKSDLDLVAVNIQDVVEDSISLVSSLARRAEVVINVDHANDVGPILGDAIQLQQVIINLVVNGMDAIKSSGQTSGTITIRTSSDSNARTVIEVEDSGSGLSEADADRLFEAFYSTKPAGLGMGLAICRSVIEQLDGTIGARNAPGGGAVFQVSLPMMADLDKAEAVGNTAETG